MLPSRTGNRLSLLSLAQHLLRCSPFSCNTGTSQGSCLWFTATCFSPFNPTKSQQQYSPPKFWNQAVPWGETKQKKTRKLAVQTRHPKKKKNTTGDGWLAVALPFAVFVDIEIGTRVGLRWISKDNNTSWVVGLRARGHREKFGIPKNRRMLRFVLLETPVSSCAKFSVEMVFFLFCFLRHEQWTVHCLS